MGKPAKQRRATMRLQLQKTAAENQRLAASLALHEAGMDSAHRRADLLKIHLTTLIKTLKRIDPRCVALQVEAAITAGINPYRIPISQTHADRSSCIYDNALSCERPALEELTQFLLHDRTIQNELQHTLHFRVLNPPDRKTLDCGYAVSQHALRSMSHPEHFTEMICREFGRAIHRQIHGKKAPL